MCCGLGGEIDFRVLHQRIESGDEAAQLAYDVYIHRLRKYIGAYLALLGTADVITFTAGVGENDAAVRRDALSGMAALGIELDEHLNASPARAARRISADNSPTTVLVIPTDEELAIARACVQRDRRLNPRAAAHCRDRRSAGSVAPVVRRPAPTRPRIGRRSR